MWIRAVAALAAVVGVGCGGSTNPDPVLSVGGTYQTAVTLLRSDCPGQGVEQHPTVVTHSPGATSLSLSHAGSTYPGTVQADGRFTTTDVTQVIAGITYVVGISGRFTVTAIDAEVTVAAGRQPPCTFAARWAGPKIGSPNVIP